MRRLLLLLLTFLLPLQLLAATAVDLAAREDDTGQRHASCHVRHAGSAARAVTAGFPAHATALISTGEGGAMPVWARAAEPGDKADNVAHEASLQSSSHDSQQGGDDDGEAPAAQAEYEDHTLPARIATPQIPWRSFPHAFSAPPGWSSFVHDQLRPPPLV